MSFANPTPLRVGMTGALAGTRYRVAGRVVVGMEEAGETYYWNEFNLVDDAGDSVTLVYEETDGGGEWKLFTWFEPDSPVSVQEAAARRVGDPVNLDGTPLRVTRVDESRVYHIEGEAPEGVEVGDVAHYFNAEAGQKMQVASWTGDEVEFYRGVDLPRGAVAAAFGLQSELPVSGFLSAGAAGSTVALPEIVPKLAGTFLALVIALVGYSSCRRARPQPAVMKTGAPPARLSVGSAGAMDGKHYRLVAHALVEIAQVGSLHDRHEYHLAGDDGNRLLLIQGLKPGAADWALFTPLQPLEPLTPQQAAALRAGDTMQLEGYLTAVGELFQSVIRQAEGPDWPDLKTNAVSFGVSGQSGDTLLLARWNDRSIGFYKGRNLGAQEVAAAFKERPRQ